MAVNNIGKSQLLRSEEKEQKRGKLGKKNGMMRGCPMGGMKLPLMALLWNLLKAQMMSVGVLGEGIPALQEMGRALVTVPDPRGEKYKESDKMG